MNEWLLALIGGVLIGLAAVLLMAVQGQIMGVSGILKRLLPPAQQDWLWRMVFLAGVLLTPIILLMINPSAMQSTMTQNLGVLIVGGLLVGAGVSVGNGCTSGHGVCGLSRLSMRSVVAVGVFMGAAFITVFVMRHVLGV